MAEKIRDARFKRADIFVGKLVFRQSAVHFKSADGRDNYRSVGDKSREPALYIEEFFRSEIGTEARFRNGIVRAFQCQTRCSHRVAAVRDIRKRSAVDKRGRAFKRLNEVRFYRVLQKRGHCANRLQITGGNGLIIVSVPYYDTG